MTEINNQISNSIEEPKKRTKQGKPRLKGILTTVAGGVVGSVLTLSVFPYTNYFENAVTEVVGQENSDSSSAVTVQKTVSTSSAASNSVADMVEEASKAIVGIVNMQTQTQRSPFPNSNENSSETVESGSGTGVVFKIDKDSAYIVTNNHVIEGAEEIEITVYGGEKATAELVGTDTLTDIAVLKIDTKYATTKLEFGDSSTLRAGDTVLAIGNPLGLDLSNTVTQGIVSAVDRNVTVTTSAGDWDLTVIQTDAAINPGNSGGALINTSGQVIGINSLKISEDDVEGLGFAIPSNDVVAIINQLMEKGQVERPYIGVGLANLEEIPQRYLQNLPSSVKSGAMVTSVDPDSAAASAGLEVEDVIVSINNHEVTSSDDLRKYLYSELKVGDKLTVKVYRGSEQKTIKLTLTSSNGTN